MEQNLQLAGFVSGQRVDERFPITGVPDIDMAGSVLVCTDVAF